MDYEADLVFRDFGTDGIPSTGLHKPVLREVRQLLGQYETAIDAFTSNGGLIYATRALALSDLAHGANSSAWVIADNIDNARNGIYQKSGASGTGTWTRIADLPYSFARMSDVGAGTVNAIIVTSATPPSQKIIRTSNIYRTNTGAVTISENGNAYRSLTDNLGQPIPSGGLTAGMMVTYVDDGVNFRLLTDLNSAAAVSAANAAAALAASYAAAVGGSLPNSFPPTRTVLKGYNTGTVASAWLTEPGREGQFIWMVGDYSTQIAADTLEGIYVKANAVAATSGAWVRRYTEMPSVTWWGADKTGTNDSAPAFQAAINMVGRFRIPSGRFAIGSTVTIAKDNVMMQGEGGLLDPAIVHYTSGTPTTDLAGAISRVATVLFWTGVTTTSASCMFRAQPYQVGAYWRNGYGFSMNDMLLDCAETGNSGFQNLSHCFQSHRNVTITRYKYVGWDVGVDANQSLGTSDSNGNSYYNCVAINRGAGSACIPGIGWWLWGDGGTTGVTAPKGNPCESNWFGGGSYPHSSQTVCVHAEYADSCKFHGFQGAGQFILHAYDTGARGLSDGVLIAAKNAQCLHFTFYGYGIYPVVKKSIVQPNAYDYNPFGHTYYDYPLVNFGVLPLVEGPAANSLKVFMPATPAEPSGGAVDWGGQEALCSVTRATTQAIANNTDTAVSFSAAISAPIGGWVIGDPTKVYVPMGVKKVRVKAHIVWAAVTGACLVSIAKNAAILTSKAITGTGAALPMEIDTRWFAVAGGDYITLVVKQQSGGSINLAIDATYSTPFMEVEFA